MRHEDCWAKTTADGRPGISVRDHCLNVGCVAQALIERLPAAVKQLLPQGAATVAALHDVGKVSPGFQQQCPYWVERNRAWFRPNAGYESRHALISQIFLRAASAERHQRAAEAIGAHHGLVQGDASPCDLGGETWDAARRALRDAIEAELGAFPTADIRSEAAEWLLAGLTAVADWLASDETLFTPKDCGLLAKDTQRDLANKVVEDLGLGNVELAADRTFERAFEERLTGNPPRPLQKRVIELPDLAPAIYVIEDAMGSGKTEAALWLTFRLMTGGMARGLYFGLPTRVTSDRIHRRVKAFLARCSPDTTEPMLVHGEAWLRIPEVMSAQPCDAYAEGEEPARKAARKWFASTRRGLLAPFAVGTVDQPLLGVVARKWFFMRQFALAGKVVVLDEVHSYDLYTGTLINRLVRRLRELKATPVILSATLTARQKAELLGEAPDANGCGQAPYPTITIKPDSAHSNVHCVLKDGETVPEKTVRIVSWPVPSFEDAASVVQEAVRLAEEGRNVVWVRNTVRHAQDAYRMLNGQKRQGSFDVGLLHSRFPAFQRGAYPQLSLDDLTRRHLHEERWLWLLGKPEPPRPDARPKASILVATQVVEQSVDIDADVLITDLAPTDMLLQRLGRLHRHDRGARGEPTAYVVVSRSLAENAESLAAAAIKDTLGGIGHVYAPYVLLRTWRQWRDRPAITLPTQIRDVLEKTYTEQENEPEDWTKLRKELEEEKRRLENLALSAVGVRGQPLGADEEGFGTRHIRQRQILLLLLRWVSSEIDRQHNPSALQLLDKKKLSVAQYGDFNLDAARRLHANAATIPAWWLPKAIREPLPPGLAQYFSEEVVLGVWDGQRAALTLGVTNRDTAPTICYRPDIGLWLERPPAQQAMRAEGDGEDEDGIF